MASVSSVSVLLSASGKIGCVDELALLAVLTLLAVLALPAPGGAGGGGRVVVSTLIGRSVPELVGVPGLGGGAAGLAAALGPVGLVGLRVSPELRDLSLSCLCVVGGAGGGFAGEGKGCTGGCSAFAGGCGGRGGPPLLVPICSLSEAVPDDARLLRERSLSICALALPGGGMMGFAGGARGMLERDRSVSVSVRLCFSGVVGLSASMSMSLSSTSIL